MPGLPCKPAFLPRPLCSPRVQGASEKRRLYRTLSTDLPDELKQKLVSLLAAEYSKKVGRQALMRGDLCLLGVRVGVCHWGAEGCRCWR